MIFEVFNQKFPIMDDCIVIILLGNNKIECKNGVKYWRERFWFNVFDQKLMIKDDYEEFLYFMSKCWHGYVTCPRSKKFPQNVH